MYRVTICTEMRTDLYRCLALATQAGSGHLYRMRTEMYRKQAVFCTDFVQKCVQIPTSGSPGCFTALALDKSRNLLYTWVMGRAKVGRYSLGNQFLASISGVDAVVVMCIVFFYGDSAMGEMEVG